MTRERGAVVVGTNPFGWTAKRPYVVVSNETHPFNDEECLCVAVTTTERDGAVPLSGTYVEGGLPKESYASPWAVVTLKANAIEKRVATVSRTTTDTIVEELWTYVS